MSAMPPKAKVPARKERRALREQASPRRLKSGVLDHLRPLLAFALHEAAEMFRGVAGDREALMREFCLDAGVGHRLVGDTVEFLDDLLRRSTRRDHAVPVFDQNIRH